MTPAAFYDLDGTLVRGNIVEHLLYYAARDHSVFASAARLARIGARSVGWLSSNATDRHAFNLSVYGSFKGFSRDRLEMLAPAWHTAVLGRLLPGAAELIAADRARGFRIFIVTGALDGVANAVGRHLGVDGVWSNRLAFDAHGICTGELIPPVLAGVTKVEQMRRIAAEHAIDLDASRAYSDDSADIPMLSAVGHPIAVNPDRQLLRVALSEGWPVLNTAETR